MTQLPPISYAPGKVFLVGAGPGDPGLVTLQARALIERCDVLVFDYLVNPVIHNWASEDCEHIDVGKSPGLKKSAVQAEIESILVDRALQGKMVVRLKGGDPFIFGRGGEEIEALLAADIPFEVVPGVTASFGAAAYTGIPLTDRRFSGSVTLVTGHESPDSDTLRVDFSSIVKGGGTLAVYMGVSTLPRIVEQLIEGGCSGDTPVAVVQWATYAYQRRVFGTVDSIAGVVEGAGIASPSVILIGNVVSQAERYNWFSTGPLADKRVVVTRATDQASELSSRLASLGAEVLEIPMIQTRAETDPASVSEVFAGIANYEWIVFTSPNGVRYFFDLFFRAFEDLRSFGGMRIACIGQATAREVDPYHLAVDLIPEKAVAESLADALVATDSLDSANVLVVTGNRNRETLVESLEQEGRAIVDTLQVYATDLIDLLNNKAVQSYCENGADYVLFTSSSTAKAWARNAEQLERAPGSTPPKHVSMGKITSNALANNDLPIDLQAENSSLDALIEVLIEDVES